MARTEAEVTVFRVLDRLALAGLKPAVHLVNVFGSGSLCPGFHLLPAPCLVMMGPTAARLVAPLAASLHRIPTWMGIQFSLTILL